VTLAALFTIPAAVFHLDSVPRAPLARPEPAAATIARFTPPDTAPHHVVDLSEGYYRRLAVHRWGTYFMVPLFGVQAALGERIYAQKEDRNAGRRAAIGSDLRAAHAAVAIGIDALFVSNTVTGVWNLVEARHAPERRKLRVVHSVLMLASDAGFAASSTMGWNHETHRNVAYASMGVTAVSAVMMLLAK
jgi:hypothetical protein